MSLLPMPGVRVIISDFGGVLTNPLEEAFLAYERESDLTLAEIGTAMASIGERDGENPLYALERGELSEPDFEAQVQAELCAQLGRDVSFTEFSESYFKHLRPNQPFIDYLLEYKDQGGRLALLTNNVKEWEPRWRAMLPIDELFETVVDSGFEGMRKPEPRIFELTHQRIAQLDGLTDIEPAECVLVDDFEVNCLAAREYGFQAVRYHGEHDDVLEELRKVLKLG